MDLAPTNTFVVLFGGGIHQNAARTIRRLERCYRLLPNPVWLEISGSVAMVANPEGAAQTGATALRTCMAVATLAERTCSCMVAARVKLAREKKCVRIDGSPSMVSVQPCSGFGQCSGYSPPTVHSASISTSGSVLRRPVQVQRCPAVVPAFEDVIEDLVVVVGGDGFHCGGDLVDAGVEGVGDEPDLILE